MCDSFIAAQQPVEILLVEAQFSIPLSLLNPKGQHRTKRFRD